MQKYRYITRSEKYYAGYEDGYRTGRLRVTRKILIRIIKLTNKEAGGALNSTQVKSLVNKINKECDLAFLDKIMYGVALKNIKLINLYKNYDSIYLTKEDIEKQSPDLFSVEEDKD
jgi:hypothetical protein